MPKNKLFFLIASVFSPVLLFSLLAAFVFSLKQKNPPLETKSELKSESNFESKTTNSAQISQDSSQNFPAIREPGFSLAPNNSSDPNDKIALLEDCDLIINYKKDKYFLVKERTTNLAIFQKTEDGDFQQILEYSCATDTYISTKYTYNNETFFPSQEFKTPIFDDFFFEHVKEAWVIDSKDKINPNTNWLDHKPELDFLHSALKTKILREIYHQIVFEPDFLPNSFSSQDLRFSLNAPRPESSIDWDKITPFLTREKFQTLQTDAERQLETKVRDLPNWKQIKFEDKVNKIADIPQELIVKHGIPRFGFRFYKGVAFWSGVLRNPVGGQDYESKFLAYDGEKVTTIWDHTKQKNSNFSNPLSKIYFLSNLVNTDGISYSYGQACGGWGCEVTKNGFFIDFAKGQYWVKKESSEETEKLIQTYLNHDFASQHFRKQPNIYNDEGYEIYRNGKIYGLFRNYEGKTEKEIAKEPTNLFAVEKDGQKVNYLYKGKNNCGNPAGLCAGEMAFNERGSIVYYGEFWEGGNESAEQERVDAKIKISEQDFGTGQILQEEEFAIRNWQESFAKYGTKEVKDRYKEIPDEKDKNLP